MVVGGCVCLLVAVCGCWWLCVVVGGCVWLLVAVCGCWWLCVVVGGCVWFLVAVCVVGGDLVWLAVV